jgi:hypothetical protein
VIVARQIESVFTMFIEPFSFRFCGKMMLIQLGDSDSLVTSATNSDIVIPGAKLLSQCKEKSNGTHCA